MKKVFVLTLALVLALGTAAMAANLTVGGELKATFEFDLNGTDIAQNDASASFGFNEFSLNASEEGLWDAYVYLGTSDALSFGKYKMAFTPELFTATVWGNGYDGGSKGTKLGFISSAKVATAPKLRLTTDKLGFSFTADYEGDNKALYLFGETDVEGVTVGGALKTSLDAAQAVAGYGVFEVDPATVTVEAARDLANEVTGYAVKGVVGVTDEVTVTAQYKGNPDFAADTNAYFVEGVYEVTNLKATGKYNVGSDEAVTISGDVTYRENADVGFGDLFKSDKYYTLTGFAVYGGASQTDDASDNNKLNFTGKAAAPLADNVWVLGTVSYTSDKDEDLDSGYAINPDVEESDNYTYETKTAVTADLHAALTDELTAEAGFGYTAWKGTTYEASKKIVLDGTLTYALSANASISGTLARTSETINGVDEDAVNTGTVSFTVKF